MPSNLLSLYLILASKIDEVGRCDQVEEVTLGSPLVGPIRWRTILKPIQRFLNQEPDEVTLPQRSAQCFNPRLRPRPGAEVDGFIEDAGLGHMATDSGIAFFHPVP